MRSLMIVFVMFLAVPVASAQTGSGSAEAGAGSAAAPVPAPAADPATLKMQVPEPTPEELRKICADAMNKNPGFAEDIVKTINEDTANQHEKAALAIAKNEKHVILAYAAMWVIAVGFLLFLWRRQQGLQSEIANLKRDLEAAAK